MTTQTLPALPSPAVPDIMEKSAETMNWLRENIAVGYTDERGPAWWANAITKDGQWEIPDGSHFDGPVPMEKVTKILDVKLVKGKVHVTYEDGDGRQVIADEDVAPIVNLRSHTVMAYPKKGYRIHPYLETLHGFTDQILDSGDVGVGSVGLLKKGGVAFLQARLQEEFEVAGYGYQPYVTAVTSADLSRRTQWVTGALGAVCDNTLIRTLDGALTAFGYKHTRRSLPRVQEARDALGIKLRAVATEMGKTIDV